MKTETTITLRAATLAGLRDDKDIAAAAHRLGVLNGEPLIIGLDALLSYAEAYRLRHGSPLAGDYVLGPCWLEAVKGFRGLLNGDGGVAMRRGITTDSKDNGACEALFWAALEAAGYTEATANL